ncbi:MAG: hemolysin III family protein [Acidimicrobiia bacterium]|nr:hemolysin III family protein [Acidimicrobiia bacterium]MDQ3501572.1 hemolysin III family protein [Actinomycetota bacterium]
MDRRAMDRWEWGRVKNPIRALLHGTAGVGAVIGVALLANAASGGRQLVAGLIYSCTLVAMYAVSVLYHSVGWQERRKQFLQRLDHSMIFLLVAGTFTPFGVVVLDGWLQVILLAMVWAIALVGIALKFVLPRISTKLSVILQHTMGWMSLLALPWIWKRLGPGAVWLLVAGGVAYSIGTVIFAIKRPRLAARTFSYHELFHVFVILGSLFHFLSVWWYVMPYSA